MKEIISDNAPAALGPYSQAIDTGNFVFVSGQLGIDPKTGKLAGEDITKQAHQSLKNIKSVLSAAGLDMSNVVKTTILLSDLGDFAEVNEIYSQYFKKPFPARACYQVCALPANGKVEIEVIAAK